jgi:hypothetical protein
MHSVIPSVEVMEHFGRPTRRQEDKRGGSVLLTWADNHDPVLCSRPLRPSLRASKKRSSVVELY